MVKGRHALRRTHVYHSDHRGRNAVFFPALLVNLYGVV